MLTIVFPFVCYVSVFIITVLLCLLLLCMLFLICMVLNICNFKQRTEQVHVELDISAIEEYILLLLLNVNRPKPIHKSVYFRAFRNIRVLDYRNDVKLLMCNRRNPQKNT